MTKEELLNDIPHQLAQDAHRGTSFVPERRGESERESYAAQLLSDYEYLAKLANTDEKRAALVEEFARYRAGYRARTLAELAARSRCVSTMIAGPSNFNVRRAEKTNNAAHRRGEELSEFRERALKAIRRTLCPELAPIMTGDADAGERLAAKIKAAEESQEAMKAANLIVRGAPRNESTPEKLASLLKLGFTDAQAAKLFVPNCFREVGFASYSLTNNAANIRRMKQRAQHVEAVKAKPASAAQGTAARVEDVPADNRVRVFFPGKPAEEVRAELKRRGFRWTPSLGCWQAYRHSWTIETARKLAGLSETPSAPVKPEPVDNVCPDGPSCQDPKCQAERAARLDEMRCEKCGTETGGTRLCLSCSPAGTLFKSKPEVPS